MKHLANIAVYFLGAAFVMGATYLAFRTDWPQPWAPLPTLTYLLFWRSIPTITYGYGAFLFLVWCIHLTLGRPGVPRRSRILFYILVVFSLVAYVGGWKYGLEYQGLIYTLAVTIINAFVIGTLYILQRGTRLSSSFTTGYAFHVLLFSWFVTYWCPYLGELP